MAPRSRDAPSDPAAAADSAAADAAVLAALARGERDALATLYDRFGRSAYALARRICLDVSLAEDVVQEVFLAIWKAPERYDPARGAVSSWLLTLVHHRAVDAVRREATRRRHTVAPAEDGEDWNVPPGPGADGAALDAVVAGHVREALAQLPAEQREALTLAYFSGYTQREVASIAGVPLGTVKSRMFTGVRRLKALLEPHVTEGDR